MQVVTPLKQLIGGAPDLIDPRRCQAQRVNGHPCGRWARPGSYTCSVHDDQAEAIASQRQSAPGPPDIVTAYDWYSIGVLRVLVRWRQEQQRWSDRVLVFSAGVDVDGRAAEAAERLMVELGGSRLGRLSESDRAELVGILHDALVLILGRFVMDHDEDDEEAPGLQFENDDDEEERYTTAVLRQLLTPAGNGC